MMLLTQEPGLGKTFDDVVLSRLRLTGLAGMALALLVACGNSETRRASVDGQAPEVGYVVVQQSRVPMTIELGARTAAYHTSDVRPQVSGIIRRRLFTEGGDVKRGQSLYQIDASLYRAAVNEAAANLAGARASAEATRAKADRFRSLEDTQVVSKQDYADILAQARLASAAVQQAQAALETAQINLKYTTVPAPISGRIGRSLFTEGALVTSNQSEPLAVIQQLDPIAVDIQQSSVDILKLRRSLGEAGVIPANAEVHLKLPDGTNYALGGSLEFSEAIVDEHTGTITLRARFANPQGLLLPGMFVRAVFAQSVDTRAILVPQSGVSRDAKGTATVLLVAANNTVVERKVSVSHIVGTYWVVTAGLTPGDKVITEGTGKVAPGQAIRPVEAGAPQDLGEGRDQS